MKYIVIFFLTGQGDYGNPHVIQEHEIHDQPKFQVYHHEENEKHDLSDLFEIALTALAYLSFGMFIVHVIMCISSVVSVLLNIIILNNLITEILA